MTMKNDRLWWMKTSGLGLAQGDVLRDCRAPVFRRLASAAEGVADRVELADIDLIVITQSCDLENLKAPFVALCPIYSLRDFESANPEFAKKGRWEQVRKGRREGLHLLASPENPDDSRSALVVDFGHIVSLPIDYLANHAETLGDRWRIESPFLEHFSQALARFFMRVGLPSSIPEFK